MAKEVRLWEITPENQLHEIKQTSLDLEDRIEDWLEEDISVLSGSLLVIGHQVDTDFGVSLSL